MLQPPRLPVRIVIVDDEVSVASAFAELFTRDARFEVMGCADSMAAGRELCLRHVPDVALVDIMLGDGSGIELSREVGPITPNVRWLIMTGCVSADLVHEAADAGAAGVVDKRSVEWRDVVDAALAIARGGEYFCAVASDFLRRGLHLIHPPLTPLEKRILHRLARYETRARIADAEGLARSTIAGRIAQIAHKLHLDAKPSASAIVPAARAAGALPRMPADGPPVTSA
jgi:DNA-binding NarL/FixJ family response regulator